MEKEFVYVLTDAGSWDYKPTFNVTVFKDFDTALNEFNKRIETGRSDIREWCNEEDIKEEQTVDKKAEYASFDIYESGYYERVHNTITLQKEEVI